MPRQQGRQLYLLIILLVLAIALMTWQVKSNRRENFLARGLLSIVSLLHQGLDSVVDNVLAVWEGYIYLIDVKTENKELQSQLARLQELNNSYLEAKLESERLRRLLNFSTKTAIKMLPAEVIGKDPSNWFKSILINKGSNHGVKNNMAVTIPEGVVGHIIEVAPTSAKVLLITDPNSSVAVILQQSRADAIMVGTAKKVCRLKYLSREVAAQQNDVVITSGMGGIFPKGLLVGRLKQVQQPDFGLFQHAEVIPNLDFTKLEEVFIIQ